MGVIPVTKGEIHFISLLVGRNVSFDFVGGRHKPSPLAPTLLLTLPLLTHQSPGSIPCSNSCTPGSASSPALSPGHGGIKADTCDIWTRFQGPHCTTLGMTLHTFSQSINKHSECQRIPGTGLGQGNTPGEQHVIPALRDLRDE